MKKKIFSIFLCIILLLSVNEIVFSTPVHATAVPIFEVGGSLLGVIKTAIESTVSAITQVGELGVMIADKALSAAEKLTGAIAHMGLVTAKIAALLIVQAATKATIGSGGGGIVSDWNQYLYISPQQRAMAQMNSFFTNVSSGRISNLNYEGVGPNYDAYLVAQARQAISGQTFATNIQQQVSDPKQMFSTGNMKGIMSFFEYANNPYSYTMVAQNKYALEFAKAQEIAKNEQDRGFLPQKTASGYIKQPAAILGNALMQVDQLGTTLIMNADDKGEARLFAPAVQQITKGALISYGARNLNYATADSEGKAKILAQNDQFPFSLAYDLKGGVGISAGGITVSTGVGAIATNGQIGNTKVAGNLQCGIAGCQTTMTTQKTDTYKNTWGGTTTSGTVPVAKINYPAYLCTENTVCEGWFGTAYKCGASGRCTAK